MVGQTIEQGVHRREAVEGVLGQRLEHSWQIARIGNQDGLAAHAQTQHHVHRESEDVVQRQSTHTGGLLACRDALHDRPVPGL